MRMKTHVTAVAVFQIGLSILGLLIAFIVLAGTFLPGLIVLGIDGDPEPISILVPIGCTVASFIIIFSLPGLVGGIGLMNYRPWARILVLILAVLGLFNFPFGTFVGIYTLWVLLNEETAELFMENL